MSNDCQLLIETPQANLSSAIQWLNVSYAVSYNRRHSRRGHLTHLSRYIHLNPVRAKMVKRPQGYRWSSYPALVGKVRGPDWLETRGLLSYFARGGSPSGTGNKREAIKHYRGAQT